MIWGWAFGPAITPKNLYISGDFYKEIITRSPKRSRLSRVQVRVEEGQGCGLRGISRRVDDLRV